MRVKLNAHLIDLDKAVELFIAKKQSTVNEYVKMKVEKHNAKKQLSNSKYC